MSLEFTYKVDPDEHGIYDGRELARQLVATAYRLLVPYVNACPACADTLFGVVANATIEELHEQGRERGQLEEALMCILPHGAEWEAAEKAHFAAASAETARLLRGRARRTSISRSHSP